MKLIPFCSVYSHTADVRFRSLCHHLRHRARPFFCSHSSMCEIRPAAVYTINTPGEKHKSCQRPNTAYLSCKHFLLNPSTYSDLHLCYVSSTGVKVEARTCCAASVIIRRQRQEWAILRPSGQVELEPRKKWYLSYAIGPLGVLHFLYQI